MQESDEALKQIDEGPISSDPTVTPVKYISDKPSTEAWRSYYKQGL